jgi:hypothetical protein
VNRRLWLAPLLLCVSAGCGSAAGTSAPPPPAGVPPSLATATGTATGTWAVVVMGGSAAQFNNFWQLFVRPSSGGSWRLATPPGVASNGGLVIAPAGGSVTAGFRPTQSLVFTPLAVTSDGGSSWSSSILNAALADVPDALAAAPGTGRLLALLANGTADMSSSGASWTRMVTQRSLAESAAGALCGLEHLTAVAFGSTGVPLLAGACAHPGNAGIFADDNGVWRAVGPALPAALARQPVTVLRMTTTSGGVVALLQAGTGPAASLLAAWSADSGGHWELSAPYRLGSPVSAASFGPGSAVAIVLGGGRGVTIANAGARWQALPALPPGTATLAAGPGSALDALAVSRAKLTVWQARPGDTGWTKIQTIAVPIQYGSSG